LSGKFWPAELRSWVNSLGARRVWDASLASARIPPVLLTTPGEIARVMDFLKSNHGDERDRRMTHDIA
jgi:hypothetical protein